MIDNKTDEVVSLMCQLAAAGGAPDLSEDSQHFHIAYHTSIIIRDKIGWDAVFRYLDANPALEPLREPLASLAIVAESLRSDKAEIALTILPKKSQN